MISSENLPLCNSHSSRSEQFELGLKVGDNFYHDKYTDASAGWIMSASILIFFMKAGFLFVEVAFVNAIIQRRRVIISKYLDTCSSALAFWWFGYAVERGLNPATFGEDHDYILWFFRFTFASNTATIIGGTLIGERRKMKLVAVLIYAFMISSVIHPYVARQFWSDAGTLSPMKFCNGTIGIVNGTLAIQDILIDSPSSIFVLDFAGSGAVHLLGGMGGLLLTFSFKVEQWLNGPKREEYQELLDGPAVDVSEQQEEPKNFLDWMYREGSEHIEYSALGVLILWTTWFAFNCGSSESISGGRSGDFRSYKIYHAITGRIALNMVICAGSGGLLASLIAACVQKKLEIQERKSEGERQLEAGGNLRGINYAWDMQATQGINTNEISNGILSCLVAITGCCAFVRPWVSFGVGIAAIVFYHVGCWTEYKLGLKDSARVVPVHAFSGFLGLMASSFADKPYVLDIYENVCYCQQLHLPDHDKFNGVLFGYQLAGALFIIAWSIVTIGPLFLLLSLIRSSLLAKLLRREPFEQRHNMSALFGSGLLLTHDIPPQRQ